MYYRRILIPLIVLIFVFSPVGAHPNAAAQTSSAVKPDLPAAQTTPELTVEVDPTLDLENFHPRAAFVVRFSQPMEPASDPEPVLTYPYVEGEVLWKDNDTVLEFLPLRGFDPASTYQVFINAHLRSHAGETFSVQTNWSLSTLSGPRIIKQVENPAVVRGHQPYTEITFDQPMDRASVAASLRVKPDITLELSWDGQKLIIRPASPIPVGDRFQLSLLAGAAGARSADSVPLDAPLQWDWLVPNFEYSLSAVTETSFVLNFNYSIDHGKVGQVFTIEPDIPGEWTRASLNSLRFTASEPFSLHQTYTVRQVQTLYHSDGRALPEITPLTFHPPPPIRSFSPKAFDHISEERTIKINFARKMDQASVEEAFSIDPPLTGEYNWSQNTLTFKIHQKFKDSDAGQYTVTLAPTARDESGELILAESFSWSFEIPSWMFYWDDDPTIFGYGANRQVVDVYGRRAIHLYAQEGWTVFRLHRLELSEFIRLNTPDVRSLGLEQAVAGLESDHRWEARYEKKGVDEVIIPQSVPPGLYILSASNEQKEKDYLFVILTSNTLLVKQTAEELYVWLSDINGSGVADKEVRLYSTTGSHVQGCRTGEDGACRIRIPPAYSPMFVTARAEGEDIAVSGLSSQWDSTHFWWWNFDGEYSTSGPHFVHTYTERPIYRPGQEVHFKSILRYDRDVRYSLLADGTPVLVNVRDARDNLIHTLQLATNAFGTIHGSFTLSEGAMLGEYSLEVIVEERSYNQKFEVQEYQKPDYQVFLRTGSNWFVTGDQIQLDVEVRTYSGEPVPDAQLTITSTEMRGKKGKTDAAGRFSINVPTNANADFSYRVWGTSSWYRPGWIEVVADDGSHQDVVASTTFRVYKSVEWLTMSRNRLISPGLPFDVDVTVERMDQEPVVERKLVLQLRKYNHKEWGYSTVVDEIEFLTGSDGKGKVTWRIEKGGHYQLYLESRDEDNKAIASHEEYVYVYSSKSSYESEVRGSITIDVERDQYKPYETAQLLIQSTFSGPALLTFERGRVIHTQWISLTAPLTIVQTPVLPAYAPNVYVVVNAYQPNNTNLKGDEELYFIESQPDSLLHWDDVQIKVDATQHALQVEISADADRYQPRQEAAFTISVRDQQGNPVDAELSVGIVDEAIYSLMDDKGPAVFDAFYGPRRNTVRSYHSFNPWRYWFAGGQGGGGGGDSMERPRSHFPDTAVWVPVARTGSDGAATVTIRLPDTLTSWRVTVKAVTANTRVGEAFINVETRQDLVVRPVLPPAMVVDDDATVAVLVNNYSDEPRQVKVSMFASLMEVTGQDQIITLTPNASEWVTWKVKAVKEGESAFIFRAEGDAGYRDAVRSVLTVKPRSVLDISTQAGILRDEKKMTVLAPVQFHANSTLEIELMHDITASLLEGLEYVTGYPYGCVEQMLSKVLPNAAVSRVLNDLSIVDDRAGQKLPEYIATGTTRLAAMQHHDGGWGWWFDDSSSDYLTSLVLFGLAVTADAGYQVDEKILQRGGEWLANNFEGMMPDSKAFALYALSIADQARPELALALYEQSDELDAFSLAALAIALDMQGYGDQARSLLSTLSEAMVFQNNAIYWYRSGGTPANRHKMDTPVRTTAMALTAFLRVAPDDVRIPEMVHDIMTQRTGKGWSSTNDTTFVILALADYLMQVKEREEEIQYRVEYDGLEVAAGIIGQDQYMVKIVLPAADLRGGLSLLKIEQQGADLLYYRIVSRFMMMETEIKPAGVIQIERVYRDPIKKMELTTFETGQLVEVSLTVQFPEDIHYVILEDYLPGGLVALNERLNTSSYRLSYAHGDYDIRFYWRQYGYNQKEVRPDRVTIFITDPGSGERTYTYLARVTYPGTFQALPTLVQAMYRPEDWGRSGSMVVTVIEP
jgi:alpha-2-macroglobulin